METLTAESLDNVDPKRRRVLDGAMKVFVAYGFARTTMDDIARAAEMSRPALYLLFRNKSEIYRAIATAVLEAAMIRADRALASEAAIGERLLRMIDDCHIAMMRIVAASPHASEILDSKGSLVGDLAAGWRRRMADRVATAIDEEAARRGVSLAGHGLTGSALANMLLDGLHGMAARSPDPEAQRRGAEGLVAIVEIVLGARSGGGTAAAARRTGASARH